MPDLILMDLMMPEMYGFEATEKIKGNELTKHIPIIIVTALASRDDMIRGISNGADDFLTKPIDSEEVIIRVRNSLKIKKYYDLLKNHNVILEERVAERTNELTSALADIHKANEKITSGYIETVHRLTIAAEYKDTETGAHIRRVGYYTRLIAEKLGMNNEYLENIFHASPMHDIGKVGIPDNILLKPAMLSSTEWGVIETHTIIGLNILSGSESPFLKMGTEIAISHHEKWDGSGYPNKLKGESIPLSGRIMKLADHYDALRGKRPYKPPFNHKKTFDIIVKGDGRTMPEYFDPDVLNVFIKLADEFNEIFETHND